MRLLLYGTGPFFSNPIKTLLAAARGASYKTSYAHFRRDHNRLSNIAAHLGCLGIQLAGNYAMLAWIDAWLRGARKESNNTKDANDQIDIVSLSTTVIWAWIQLRRTSGAPFIVKVASAAAIVAFYKKRHFFMKKWEFFSAIAIPLEAAALQVYAVKRPFRWVEYTALLAARYALHFYLLRARGSLASCDSKRIVNLSIAAFMAGASQKFPAPVVLGLIASPLALLTSQPWIFLYGWAYLASLAQGLSHHFTGELATILQLVEDESNLPSELSHVNFFPTLLLHSLWQSAHQQRTKISSSGKPLFV